MRLHYLLPIAFALFTSAAHAGIETAREAYERKDYAAALSEFHVLGKRGNTEALAILAIMYLNGEGVPRDAHKAIEFASKLIELRDKQGYSLLSTIYLSPQSGVRDKEKGLQFLRTGVDKGEENSLVHMADLMMYGAEVPQDFEKAFNYYEKAAEKYENIIAAHQLGILYEYGIGRPVDEVKALKWYEAGKHVTARPLPMIVANLYVRQAALKVRKPRRPRDLADAVALLEEAVKSGNGEALHRLGKLYETGHGVAQDYLTAASLYERGSDAGNAGAMYSGGLLFAKGLGVKQSNSEAMIWFREAAEKRHPEAGRRMAKFYDDGGDVTVHPATAPTWYCRAVIQEAAVIANPLLRAREIEPPVAYPVAEQLAILDQCVFDQEWQKASLREARAILSRQLTPAIEAEVDRLSKAMKASRNITKVLAAKG